MRNLRLKRTVGCMAEQVVRFHKRLSRTNADLSVFEQRLLLNASVPSVGTFQEAHAMPGDEVLKLYMRKSFSSAETGAYGTCSVPYELQIFGIEDACPRTSGYPGSVREKPTDRHPSEHDCTELTLPLIRRTAASLDLGETRCRRICSLLVRIQTEEPSLCEGQLRCSQGVAGRRLHVKDRAA